MARRNPSDTKRRRGSHRTRQDTRFKPYDTALRELLETDPQSWLHFLHIHGQAVLIDADLSSIVAPSDKLLRVEGASPFLVQVELQASYDPSLPERSLEYNVLARRRHGLPVMSIVVLLRPSAGGPQITGEWRQSLPDGSENIIFQYRIVRLWEQPVEELLSEGIGILPLAPLAAITDEQLPSIVHRMRERMEAEAAPGEAGKLWAAAFLLLGLRYSPEVAKEVTGQMVDLRESSTYQAILTEGRIEGRTEGRAEEARALLLRLGQKRFGLPPSTVIDRIEQITEVAVIEQYAEHLFDAADWHDLLREH